MPRRILQNIISVLLTSTLALMSLVAVVAPAGAAGANLIANPDLETASAHMPAAWQFNAWGTIAATGTYEARTEGGHAVHTKVTSRTSGDAKWYFTPVAVTAGQTYTFSDEYKGTAAKLVAQYTMADNSNTYADLGTTAATSAWQTAQFTITPGANVAKLTVFHLLEQPGDLWLDNANLAQVAPVTNGNLIGNGSAELAQGTVPSGWQSNAWGTLTPTFSYLAAGAQDGTRSLYTKVSGYTSGDAKWYFTPVNVTAGKNYIFTNYYHATVPTDTIVQYTKADGSLQYDTLGTNPAATVWTQTRYTFTTPANTAKVSIFHVIAANGELWVDNYNLFADESNPNPTSSSDVPNPSVETPQAGSTTRPASWTTNKWGTNTTQFSYPNTGHTGSRSVRTTISSYTDGDAKWYFTPIALTAGKDYVFTDYYQANTDSRVVVEVTKSDGSVVYLELPVASPSPSSWAKYTGTFTMPAGGSKATVYHMLSKVGQLTTDDYDIKPYTAVGFTRGLVTLTFDDGWEDNSDTALPTMQQFGYLSNQFYATTFIQNPSVPDWQQRLMKFKNAGHEIGSHTITHPDLTTLTAAQVNTELTDSRNYLQNLFGMPVPYFATPYGAYNDAVRAQIMQRYTLHRTVDEGYNSKDNFDVSRLKVQNILDTTTAAEVAGWAKKAHDDKTWLILVYHRVANDPGPYDTTPALFTAQLQAIKNAGIPVVKISQALGEIQPQL